MVADRDYFVGPIMFSWNQLPNSVPLPVITSNPANITSTFGSAAAMSVQFASTFPATVQWYHNGQAISGATQTNLVWSQLKLTDLGTYQVRVSTSYWTVYSDMADIQFNSEGLSTVAARHKLFDAISSGLIGK